MKKQNNALRKLVFGLIFLCAGMQGVFAALNCEGTIYFKLPDGWKSAYVVAGGNGVRMTASEFDGWLSLDASKVGGTNDATTFNIEETGKNDCNSGHCATGMKIDTITQMNDKDAFNCNDLKKTGEVWIQVNPDPDKHTTPYVNSVPPDVKYFYIFLPNKVEWKSSIPYMSVDGKPGEPLSAVPDANSCGWFFKRYIDEEPPSSVLIYRDDDETMAEAIGMEGDWGAPGTAPTPINLSMLFEAIGSNDLYFVAADEFADKSNPDALGWTTVMPAGVVGDCGYNLAALIYDTDASLHGAFTCNPDWFEGQTDDEARANACFYSGVPYNVVSSSTGTVPCIGITQGMVNKDLTADANGKKKPTLTAIGKKCFGSQADAAFAAMFNSTPGVNETYCFDLPFTQTSDGKYEFDSDNYESPGATVGGGFYPAEEPPAADRMLSERLEEAEYKRKAEGPVFFCADYNNQMTRTPEGLRTIHAVEGVPVSDLICNGSGWEGGIDCEGLFAAGSEFANNGTLTATGRAIQTALGVTWEGDGWGWACPNMGPIGWTYYKDGTENKAGELKAKNQIPANSVPRWTSGVSDAKPLANAGRNQHFCFESHATFRYKKGLKFSFRGDDDIWVFINNKLAVDLGGTHLAAPGYVDVDLFMQNENMSMSVGSSYPIDIFFCDRRTTMSNVRIKTNMFIQQTSGAKKSIESKKGGRSEYDLTYCETGDGSCAAAVGGGDDGCHSGDELCQWLGSTGKGDVDYTIEDANENIIKGIDELAANSPLGTVHLNGGVDLTNRCKPVIDQNKISGLPPNTYNLVAHVNGKKIQFQFKVAGNLGVVNKPAWVQDASGNRLPDIYNVTSLALASTDDNPSRIPVYISSVMPQGDDSLLLDVTSAAQQSYALEVMNEAGSATSDLTIEYKDADGSFKLWDGRTSRKITEDGVDTIYISMPMAMLKQSTQNYTIKVKDSQTEALPITFFAPTLVFVADTSSITPLTGGDPSERWTGSIYNFYLLALAPVQGTTNFEPCGDRCSFSLAVGSMTSTGLVVDTAGLHLENGRAMISMYSQKEYRTAGNGTASNAATLAITGPNPLIKAEFTPLYFRNPPVPTPVFADIFDVRGAKPSLQMVIDQEFFSMEQEYLDGIADSLVIYYHRPFYNSTDSLPNRIAVLWDGDGKDDTVYVSKDQFDPMVCGKDAGLDDTLCLPRISISGVNFSKEIKTASPAATLISFATFVDRGRKVEDKFPANINDRVAPVIKGASVYSLSADYNKMTIDLSEEVKITDQTFTTQGFSVFLNSANSLSGKDKYVVGVVSPSALTVAGDKVTINFYASSDKGVSPHTGDYVRFRADAPIWTDVATPVAGTADSLRPANDASFNWNYPTDYNSTVRLPSPWAPVTGEAETGVKSVVYTEVSTEDEIPPSITTVKGYPITDDFKKISEDNPGVLGYFLMSDMYSLIYSDSAVSNYYSSPEHAGELDDIFMEFEMDVFTNLGGFVAHENKRISCTDKDIFGEGHNCLDTQRNFFISWNTVSSDGRLVGTGVYVSKMKSAVHLGKRGTRAKMDKTAMWGVRRINKPVKPKK